MPPTSPRVALPLAAFLFAAGCASESAPPSAAAASRTMAEAAAIPADQVFDASKLDRMPVPTFQARPQYPFELRKRGVPGEAVVDFIVDLRGNVVNAYSLRESNPAFGMAAVVAVSQWKFRPGMKGNRPVYTHMQVPIVFSLNEQK